MRFFILVASVFLAVASPAFAQVDQNSIVPSFSCSKAGTETEKAICDAESGLAINDIEMQTLVAELKAWRPGLYSGKRQKAWLQKRDACNSDVECIRKAYNARAEELTRALLAFSKNKSGIFSYDIPQDDPNLVANGNGLFIVLPSGKLHVNLSTWTGIGYECSVVFEAPATAVDKWFWKGPISSNGDEYTPSVEIEFSSGAYVLKQSASSEELCSTSGGDVSGTYMRSK